jgi:hypothetical protein
VRVRFGELRESEQKLLADFDARVDQLFAEALSGDRDPAWWRERVRGISPQLSAEQTNDGTLLIRGVRRRDVPLAERAVARSPAALKVAHRRPAEPFASVIDLVRSAGHDFARASARVGVTRGHLLDIVIRAPAAGSAGARDAAEALVWRLLGEQVAEDWIASVHAVPAPRGGPLKILSSESDPPGVPLIELASTVAAAVRGIHAGLPDAPLWVRHEEREWTLFELTPEPAEDWPEEDDLVMAATCVPELLKCHLEKAPFSSVRFSRHGEQCFHLKFRGEGTPDARLATRLDLEDRLDRALIAERAGCVVGGGLGVRYTYVHLMLHDVGRALGVVQQVARARNLPVESWVQPFEGDWADEWVEIWPGAPAPPMA